MRDVREELIAARHVVNRADGEVRQLFPVAIGPREGAALRDAVVSERAVRTLEAGLGFAMSTLFICEGLLANGDDVRHVAADPYQFVGLPSHETTYAGVGVQILGDAGVRGMVEFYAEESQLVFPRLLSEGREFDLAFIDGNHRFEAVFLDLVYAGRLLREGSIVFVDDVQLPGPRQAVRFCVANLGWVLESDGSEDAHEWVVLRTGAPERLLRPHTAFVAF